MQFLVIALVVGLMAALVVSARPQLLFFMVFFWVSFLILPAISVLVYSRDVRGDAYQSVLVDAFPSYLLFILGVYLANPKSEAAGFASIDQVIPFRRSLFYALAAFFVLDVYLRSYFGVLVAGTGNRETLLLLPYWYSIASSLLRVFSLAMFLYGALHIRSAPLGVMLLVLAYLIFSLISAGRSAVVFALIAGVSFWSRSWVPKLRMHWIVAGGIAIGSFVLLTPIWVRARAYYRVNREGQDVGTIDALLEAFSRAWKVAQRDTYYLAAFDQNLENRGNAGLFFLDLVRSCRSMLLGESTLLGIQWALPSFLVAKPEMTPERLLQESCRLPVTDEATSALAYFWVDFGWAGAILAGVFVGLILRVMLAFALHSRLCVLSRMLLVSAFFTLSFVQEYEIIGYIVFMRDMMLVILVIEIMFRLFQLQPRRI